MDTPRRKCPRCAGPLDAVPLVFTLSRWCPSCQLLYVRPQDDQRMREDVDALGGLGALRNQVPAVVQLKRAA